MPPRWTGRGGRQNEIKDNRNNNPSRPPILNWASGDAPTAMIQPFGQGYPNLCSTPAATIVPRSSTWNEFCITCGVDMSRSRFTGTLIAAIALDTIANILWILRGEDGHSDATVTTE